MDFILNMYIVHCTSTLSKIKKCYGLFVKRTFFFFFKYDPFLLMRNGILISWTLSIHMDFAMCNWISKYQNVCSWIIFKSLFSDSNTIHILLFFQHLELILKPMYCCCSLISRYQNISISS